MKKYAILMSNNNYLYTGLKAKLEEHGIHLFHENEMDIFLTICTGELVKCCVVFYDDDFYKITTAVFHDRPYLIFHVDDLKVRDVYELLSVTPSGLTVENTVFSKYKSRAIEKKVIYYYAFHKMSYRRIAEKVQIQESRVSYLINSYVRGMNYKNKNEFVLNIENNEIIKL